MTKPTTIKKKKKKEKLSGTVGFGHHLIRKPAVLFLVILNVCFFLHQLYSQVPSPFSSQMLEQLQGPQHYLEGERRFLSPVIKRGTQASLLLHQWPRGCHVLTGSGLEYRNQWHVNQGHSPEAGGWISPLQIPRLLWHSGRVERRRRSPPQARTWLLWDSKDLALQILWGLGAGLFLL